MSGDHEFERLRQANPVSRHAPPAPGSPRFHAILEQSMSQTSTRVPPAVPMPPRRRTGWPVIGAGAVAAAAVAVVVALGGHAPSPDAKQAGAGSVLLAAAEATEQVSTLRFSQPAHGGGNFSA